MQVLIRMGGGAVWVTISILLIMRMNGGGGCLAMVALFPL